LDSNGYSEIDDSADPQPDKPIWVTVPGQKTVKYPKQIDLSQVVPRLGEWVGGDEQDCPDCKRIVRRS